MKKAISSIVAAGVMFSGIATQTVSADVKHVDNNPKKAPISKPASKEKEILFLINGKKLNTQYKPVMKNNRVFVPLQPIADSLPAKIKWDNKTKKTTVAYKGKKVVVTNGQKEVLVNGKKTSLDVPVQTINGKTYVPLKVISEGLGGKFYWDAKSSAVSINFQKDIILSMDRMLYSTSYNLIMKDNRILVPLNAISYSLEGELRFDSKTKKTTFTYKEKKIEVTDGQKAFFVNGKKIALDVPIQTINGKVYVPLKVVSEGIGGKVNWDAKSNTVTIRFKERIKENYYYVDGKGKVGEPITYQQYNTMAGQGIAPGKELVRSSGTKDVTDGTITYDIERVGTYTVKGKKSYAYLSIEAVTDKQGKVSDGMYYLYLGNEDYKENEHSFHVSDKGKLEGFNSYEEVLNYSTINAIEKIGYADYIDKN